MAGEFSHGGDGNYYYYFHRVRPHARALQSVFGLDAVGETNERSGRGWEKKEKRFVFGQRYLRVAAGETETNKTRTSRAVRRRRSFAV